MVYILGKSTKGKGSAFKGIVPVVLVSGLSFLIPEWLFHIFVGAELAGGCSFSYLISMYNFSQYEIYKSRRLFLMNIVQKLKKGSPLKVGKTLQALSPFILIFVVLLLTSNLVPPIHDALSSFATSVKNFYIQKCKYDNIYMDQYTRCLKLF